MKNILIPILVLLSALILSSCGQVQAPEVTEEEVLDTTDTNVDIYIGLDVESAQRVAAEKNTTLRVVEQDGTLLATTMDYRP